MNDLDDLKRKWKSIDIPDKNGNAAEKAAHLGNAHLPVKDRIVRRLQRMVAISMAGVMSAPLLSREFNAPLWFVTLFILYFILASCMNWFMISKLKRFDFATTTTIEAINFVTRFTKIRNRLRTIMICCAIPLLAMMLWVIDHGNEPMLFASAAAGAIIGICIGICINRRFKHELDLMQRQLNGCQ